jgi:hypothetical protein
MKQTQQPEKTQTLMSNWHSVFFAPQYLFKWAFRISIVGKHIMNPTWKKGKSETCILNVRSSSGKISGQTINHYFPAQSLDELISKRVCTDTGKSIWSVL